VTIGAVIEKLREGGGVVMLDANGVVRFKGNATVMTPEIRAALERRADLVRQVLEEERAATLANTTARSPGPCDRCGRIVWFGQGAERLVSGELVCGDCLAPWDVEAGSVPIVDPEGEGYETGLL